ncbi:MAG: ABC transporter ATP-binding protein/permease [Clostridiales bacterium]|nr:ABC transporter ATP-binding protein/permease [Clostridiales bacterium]
MFKLLRFLKGMIPATIAAPLCKLIEAIFELAVPMIIASVIDVGIANGDKSYVIKYCLLIGGLAIAGFLISVTGQILAAKVAMGFGTKLRQATFKRINKLPISTTDKIGNASLVTRITGDVTGCQNAVNLCLRLVLRMPFVVIGAFVMSMIIDPILSLMFLAMTVVLSCTIWLVLRLTMPRVKRAQKNLDEISRTTAQSITGSRVIRAFSKQADTKADFDGVADTTAKTNIGAARISTLLTPLTFAVVNLAIIAVLWFGSVKVNIGTLTQGETFALINYLQQAFFVIVNIGNVFSTFTRSSACAARVNEVLDAPEQPNGTLTDIPSDCDEVLRFDGVYFAYDGDYDVRDVSFTLKRGQTLGIIGGTGSGKSTVIALAEKFYIPAKGEISFCGKPLNEYDITAVRRAIGYVPQRAALLRGSLSSNLRVADESATDERLIQALNVAQAAELVQSIGLDGVIENDGKNLSGGQKQRVSIARSLCRDNVLYLFDDVTSALDYRTERDFINAVKQIDGAKVFVSQRISAVSGCDNIIVLDGGKIVGVGTHEQLKSDCPLYAEFCSSQS